MRVRIIAAAETKASEIGQPMNIAVADAGGNLIAGVRIGAGAWLGSIDISIKKAYTSRAFDIATKDLAAHSQSGGQFSESTPPMRPAHDLCLRCSSEARRQGGGCCWRKRRFRSAKTMRWLKLGLLPYKGLNSLIFDSWSLSSSRRFKRGKFSACSSILLGNVDSRVPSRCHQSPYAGVGSSWAGAWASRAAPGVRAREGPW